MNRFDCMTEAELAGWMAAAMIYNHGRGNPVPCFDCPAWYEAEMTAAGTCNRPIRITAGRPVVVTDDPAVIRRREQWAAAGRAARQRARRLARKREKTRQWKAQLRADVEAVRASRVAA